MKKLLLLAAFAVAALPLTGFCKVTEKDASQVMITVAQLLERGHYAKKPVNDEISKALLDTYLENLDSKHLFFTGEDIASLKSQYATELDDYILLGNPKPAREIHAMFVQRVEDRIAKVLELLKVPFKFTENRTIEVNRQKAPWPKDAAAADALWRDRIEGELLQEKLAETHKEEPTKILEKRYTQMLRNIRSIDDQDVLTGFLASLAAVYDPHSEYMGPSELENFEISMKLSLVGIGAVLRTEDGYAKIMDLVPGGPAEMSGKLKVGDKIVAVAQDKQEFVDIFEMKLDKAVALIRGKKGTKVRLQVFPVRSRDPGQRKIVELVRDEIQLKEQEAKAEVIERKANGAATERLGWITLNSFYADMSKDHGKDSKSTTKDVARLIERLKKEGIQSLVVDLRRNGGGSLDEAIKLTGLFIKSGPVVQAKDANGSINISRDPDPAIVYDGPLVILISRMSASASEIFAAALQDYGRAVIVGDTNTFGKGTVQTMLDLARFIPNQGTEAKKSGALKLTIQQFYRISGGSTQLRGVVSDVKLPSLTDLNEIGEASMRRPLPFDEVQPLRVDRFAQASPATVDELRRRSQERVGHSRLFKYVMEDVERSKQLIEENAISLNEKLRRKEIAEDKARNELREKARKSAKVELGTSYEVTVENADNPQLKVAVAKKKPKVEDEDEPAEPEQTDYDAEKQEALSIASDLAALLKLPATASHKP